TSTHSHGLAYDAGVGPKAPLPVAVAENDDGWRSRTRFLGCVGAAQERLDSENAEQLLGSPHAGNLLGAVISLGVDRDGLGDGERLERPHVVVPFDKAAGVYKIRRCPRCPLSHK